ncbi:MAG: PhoX family protein [Panacagrimonas sp.]
MNDPRQPASADFDGDIETNLSDNPTFSGIFEARLSRRQVLLGGISAATLAAFNAPAQAKSPLGCLLNIDGKAKLGFTPVAKSLADTVSVPEGYTVTVLYATGDPIDHLTPDWADNGSETGASFAFRAGDHHDGMYYFGLSLLNTPQRLNSFRGLLALNHENITQAFLHANGPTLDGAGNRLVADEVIKEMNAHGVSIIEIARPFLLGSSFKLNRGSRFNRRITSFTEMLMSGPAAGDPALRTRFAPLGLRTRGTVNNCANGFTPWGTYLTCEENYAGYFRRDQGDNNNRTPAEVVALNRNGLAQGARGNYGWTTVAPADPEDTSYSRWNATVVPNPLGAAGDFRNAPNTFGWVVEIDPYKPGSVPRKRTAMGRFAHEGAWPANFKAGKPVVFYMGDDSRGEYIYKFVSEAVYNPLDTGIAAGDKYLDRGTLYVARFNADGSGEWRSLVFGENDLGLPNTPTGYQFASQADVLINARLAADVRGATKMDRPEWAAVNRVNGEVYFTLTNNSARGVGSGPAVDAANPRSYTDLRGSTTQRGNVNGHIIRWRESNDDPAATSFQWDVYLFGAEADADPSTVNVSGLSDVNDFSSPDGLWFGRAESCADDLLWIETDDGAYVDETNCMLLAAVPGQVGDGAARSIGTQNTFVGAPASGDNIRRFLVGPKGCEITGLDSTPDGRALFVNIQHPGEDTPVSEIANPAAYQSHWPAGGTSRPRSTTIVITRKDGGVVGL